MYDKIVCVAFQIGLGRSLQPVFIAMDGRRDASPSFKEPAIRRSIVAALTWPRRGRVGVSLRAFVLSWSQFLRAQPGDL